MDDVLFYLVFIGISSAGPFFGFGGLMAELRGEPHWFNTKDFSRPMSMEKFFPLFTAVSAMLAAHGAMGLMEVLGRSLGLAGQVPRQLAVVPFGLAGYFLALAIVSLAKEKVKKEQLKKSSHEGEDDAL